MVGRTGELEPRYGRETGRRFVTSGFDGVETRILRKGLRVRGVVKKGHCD